MIKRNFDEMIAYFNRTLSDMDISQQDKMILLGIVTAIGQEHEWTLPVQCKDCKYYHPNYCEEWSRYGTIQTSPDEYCSRGERKTDD